MLTPIKINLHQRQLNIILIYLSKFDWSDEKIPCTIGHDELIRLIGRKRKQLHFVLKCLVSIGKQCACPNKVTKSIKNYMLSIVCVRFRKIDWAFNYYVNKTFICSALAGFAYHINTRWCMCKNFKTSSFQCYFIWLK